MVTEKVVPHHTDAKEQHESKAPLVTKQPQSKQKAALDAHIYLYADSNWAAAYFDKNDLRSLDRELFG
jgi:hypothetical protein